MIKTDLSGFVVPVHSGLCEQYAKSNYIFMLNLTPGFNGLGKDNYNMRREAIKFCDLVRLILDTLRYMV